MNLIKTTIESVIEMYTENNVSQPKMKASNNAILALCDLVENKQATISVENARGLQVLNRGSVVECLVKLLLNTKRKNVKKASGLVDVTCKGVKYEIKFSTSSAYATPCNSTCKNVILVNTKGVYLVDINNLNYNKYGKILPNVEVVESTLIEF